MMHPGDRPASRYWRDGWRTHNVPYPEPVSALAYTLEVDDAIPVVATRITASGEEREGVALAPLTRIVRSPSGRIDIYSGAHHLGYWWPRELVTVVRRIGGTA